MARIRSAARPVSKRAGFRRKPSKKSKTPPKEAWLNWTIIKAIKKMKLAGLRHALKPGVSLRERIWWIGVFLFCLGITAYLTVDTVYEYAENPVLHTVEADGPIFENLFPAATITGTMIFHNNAIHDTEWLQNKAITVSKFEVQGKTWNLEIVDRLILVMDHLCELVRSFSTATRIIDEDKIQKYELKANPDQLENKDMKLSDNIVNKENGMKNTIAPYLKEKMLDCKNILAACLWEGKNKSCTELFVPVMTDVGMGCSFNRVPDKLLQKGQGFISLFNNHEYPEEELKAWRKYVEQIKKNESVVSANSVEDFMKMVHPRVQRHAGKLRGLSFMVKFDEDVESQSCPIVDSYGYLLAIHSPFESPEMMHTSVTIPPRHEVFVSINAEVTTSDKDVENLSIWRRKCYFQKENPLQNFKIYTLRNCQKECLGKAIKKDCNCTLLTLSVGENETICGPTEQDCVRATTDNLEQGRYDRVCVNPVCYPPCNDVKYGAETTYLPYHTNDIFNPSRINKNNNNTLTAIAHVAFDSDSISRRRRKLQYGWGILIGVIGGLWGSTLEVTIFTFFNVMAAIGVMLFTEWVCGGNETTGDDSDDDGEWEDIGPPEIIPGDAGNGSGDMELAELVITIENERDTRQEISNNDDQSTNREETSADENPQIGQDLGSNENTGEYGNTIDNGEVSEAFDGNHEDIETVEEPISGEIENGHQNNANQQERECRPQGPLFVVSGNGNCTEEETQNDESEFNYTVHDFPFELCGSNENERITAPTASNIGNNEGTLVSNEEVESSSVVVELNTDSSGDSQLPSASSSFNTSVTNWDNLLDELFGKVEFKH